MSVTGSCRCGNVQFAIDSDCLLTYAGHYTVCQKRTGSAFSIAP